MNERDRGALLGMVYGDASIIVRKRYEEGREDQKVFVLTMKHSFKQAEYVEQKAKRLNQMFGGQCKIAPHFAVVDGKKYPQVGIQKSNKYLEQVRGWCYPEGKHRITQQVLDWITDEGLAYWFLDDGSVDWWFRVDGSVTSAQGLFAICRPESEAEMVREWLGKKFGIETKLSFHQKSKSFVLRFNTQAVKRMIDTIRPYTPDCLKYKIEPARNSHEPPTPVCFEPERAAPHTDTEWTPEHRRMKAAEYQRIHRAKKKQVVR
jgi:hypothetical protein